MNFCITCIDEVNTSNCSVSLEEERLVQILVCSTSLSCQLLLKA